MYCKNSENSNRIERHKLIIAILILLSISVQPVYGQAPQWVINACYDANFSSSACYMVRNDARGVPTVERVDDIVPRATITIPADPNAQGNIGHLNIAVFDLRPGVAGGGQITLGLTNVWTRDPNDILSGGEPKTVNVKTIRRVTNAITNRFVDPIYTVFPGAVVDTWPTTIRLAFTFPNGVIRPDEFPAEIILVAEGGGGGGGGGNDGGCTSCHGLFRDTTVRGSSIESTGIIILVTMLIIVSIMAIRKEKCDKY